MAAVPEVFHRLADCGAGCQIPRPNGAVAIAAYHQRFAGLGMGCSQGPDRTRIRAFEPVPQRRELGACRQVPYPDGAVGATGDGYRPAAIVSGESQGPDLPVVLPDHTANLLRSPLTVLQQPRCIGDEARRPSRRTRPGAPGMHTCAGAPAHPVRGAAAWAGPAGAVWVIGRARSVAPSRDSMPRSPLSAAIKKRGSSISSSRRPATSACAGRLTSRYGSADDQFPAAEYRPNA